MAGEVRLEDVADIIMGQSPPGETYNEVGDGLPFFQVVADFNYRHPTTRVYCSAPSRIAKLGDILLSVRAPIGRVNVADRECAIGRGLSIIRAQNPEDQRYLEFVLRSVEFRWAAIEGGGSVFGNATRNDLETLAIPWPDPSQRCAIAHILCTLDDKIELNRQMSETLEQMARAIFKAWFVDFESVRAKCSAKCRGEPPCSPPSRQARGPAPTGEHRQWPQHIIDLFPARLMDSELGKIPEGWEVVTLAELMEIDPPRALRKGVVAPYLDMANMPVRGHVPLNVIERAFSSGSRFINGDTLLARITPCLENGKTAYVDFLRDGQVGWGSTEFIVLRPRPPLPTEFAYYLARSEDFREYAIQSMTGTSGRQRVQPNALAHYQLAKPSGHVALAFGNIAHPLFAAAKGAADESRTLAALRDALLPKLISGELRVKNAERFLKEWGL